ncbi:hypothetical protein K3495_g5591 [Podosphaera aphanis]|nr:hypothetical protein K3495_g5591 [Podosphaera aphanis]
MWCTRNEIWENVCPEVIGDQPENIRPQAPSLPAVLDAETGANFQIQNAVHSNDLRIWREKDLALKQLDETVKTTVGDQFKQHLMGKLTERAKLIALYEQVKLTAASLKADLKAEYELLKVTPYGKSVSEYFSRWQILCVKCQINKQASNHSIFITGEEDSSLGLHEALQLIHPVTAIFGTNNVNDNVKSGKEVKLLNEIKARQTFLNSKAIVKFPTKTSVGKNAAFPTATLEGRDI